MTEPYVKRDWNKELRELDTIVVLGAYGGAQEVYWQLMGCHPGLDFVFVDDATDIREVTLAGRTFPVVKDWDFSPYRKGATDRAGEPFSQFVVGLGYPRGKKTFVEKALAHGLRPAPTGVHPNSVAADDCEIGRGGLIFSGCILTAKLIVGDYVLIQNMTLGYGDVIGDYSSCYTHSSVSSEVRLGEGCLVGAGAVIREIIDVAPWTTIGAQSFVGKDITEPGGTYVGVPAKRIK
jgi:acetyltransferase-like isoleucine patch superfamily enzyme